MRKLGIDLTLLIPQFVSSSHSVTQLETDALLTEYSDVSRFGIEASISVNGSVTP